MSTELSSITSATSSRSAELLSWKRKSGKTTASLRSTFLSQFTSPRRKDSADRKSTRLNSSHGYNIVCRLLLEKKKKPTLVPGAVPEGGLTGCCNTTLIYP